MSSSTRNTVLGFVLLVAIAAGGWYVVTRGGHLPEPKSEDGSTAVEMRDYIVMWGSEYYQDTRAFDSWIAFYDMDGTFVKKIDTTGVRALGRGMEIDGENFYFQTGSKAESAIAALSPRTSEMRVLEFTRTINTNLASGAPPIVGCVISKDEKWIAWQNASKQLFVSRMDGSEKREVMVDYYAYGSFPSVSGFSDDGRFLHYSDVRDGRGVAMALSLETGKTEERTIPTTSSTGSYEQEISPSGRYIAELEEKDWDPDSEWEYTLLITDTVASTTARVPFDAKEFIMPKDIAPLGGYQPYIVGFSSDESELLFGFFGAGYGWAGTYLVKSDGTNLRTLFRDAQPIKVFSDASMIVERTDGGSYMADMEGNLKQKFGDGEEYFGILHSRIIEPQSEASPVTGETELVPTIKPDVSDDVSKWMHYKSEELGLEMNYPPNLSIRPSISADPGNEVEFWRDILGRVYLSTQFWAINTGNNINFEIRVKRSNLPIEEFVRHRGMGISHSSTTTFAGYPAWRDGLDIYGVSYDGGYAFTEQLVLKNGDVFYFFDFEGHSATLLGAEALHRQWEDLAASIRLFPVER